MSEQSLLLSSKSFEIGAEAEAIAKPGDFIVSTFSTYQHWSIVSDKLCSEGKLMLISATKRTGTVKEEPWDRVVNGQPTKVVADTPILSPENILQRARSQIGVWKYSVTSKNCEHFVNWAGNEKISSKQVFYTITGATTLAAIYALVEKNPKLFWVLLAVGVGGFLGLFLSRPTTK